MTKDEALKLGLEALELSHPRFGIGTAIHIKAVAVIKETLAQPEPNYKKALEVWLDKTEWVQETVKSHELGMHRADVLKQRIEEALAQPEQPKVRTGDCLLVGVCASEGHKIQPQRTWVQIDEDDWIKALELCDFDKVAAFEFFELKLKDKNERR